ncbi:MAG: CvpA family protein [Clostridia bacterium]|nr:CvpA family protein [Clostridia bacterium]
MGIVLDIMLLAILVLSIFFGYKKGLISVVFNLCAFLVAIIITWILYTPITNAVIKNTEIDDNIKNVIIEKGVIQNKENEQDENGINKYIQEYVTSPITNTANNVVEETAKVISEKVVAIGTAIVLFVVVRIGLILLKFVVEEIANLPIIKQFNKAGGTIYGAIRGMFIIYIFLAIMFFVMSVNNSGMIANLINTSLVSKYLYANNLILNIIF